MKLSQSLVLTAAAVILLGAGRLFAQSPALSQSPDLSAGQAGAQNSDLEGLKVRELHPNPTPNVRELNPKATPTPFPLDAATQTVSSLNFLAPGQMSAEDRVLAESSQAEIRRRAELQGFHLGSTDEQGGGWAYEQAVCPAIPNQLLLEYSRRNGDGDFSLFSVAVPRGAAVGGHVRLIPAQRRGYSLFTPASRNDLTLNDFNHMVREEPQGLSPDWLTLALCYAALSGGHVRAALQAYIPAEEHYPLLVPVKLVVSNSGGAQVHIADSTPGSKHVDWIFTFAQDGRLMRVRNTPSTELREKPVKGTAIDVDNAADSPKPSAQAN